MKNSNMVRENGDFVQDGADEKMLGTDDKESLALKSVEVKFISGDPNQNGDAKIDIGSVEKVSDGKYLRNRLSALDEALMKPKAYKLPNARWAHIQFQFECPLKCRRSDNGG